LGEISDKINSSANFIFNFEVDSKIVLFRFPLETGVKKYLTTKFNFQDWERTYVIKKEVLKNQIRNKKS